MVRGMAWEWAAQLLQQPPTPPLTSAHPGARPAAPPAQPPSPAAGRTTCEGRPKVEASGIRSVTCAWRWIRPSFQSNTTASDLMPSDPHVPCPQPKPACLAVAKQSALQTAMRSMLDASRNMTHASTGMSSGRLATCALGFGCACNIEQQPCINLAPEGEH